MHWKTENHTAGNYRGKSSPRVSENTRGPTWFFTSEIVVDLHEFSGATKSVKTL